MEIGLGLSYPSPCPCSQIQISVHYLLPCNSDTPFPSSLRFTQRNAAGSQDFQHCPVLMKLLPIQPPWRLQEKYSNPGNSNKELPPDIKVGNLSIYLYFRVMRQCMLECCLEKSAKLKSITEDANVQLSVENHVSYQEPERC